MKRRRVPSAPWAAVFAVLAAGDAVLAAEDASRDLDLPPEVSSIDLPAGRSVVAVYIPQGRFVSLGVFGPSEALRGFDMTGSELGRLARRSGVLDEDGWLPHVTSLPIWSEAEWVTVIVDAEEPVILSRTIADPGDIEPRPRKVLERGSVSPRALVGLPIPRSIQDGYVLQGPSRYHFVRVDVALVLLDAFRKTQRRFRADPVAIADASQWDGKRPATDRGNPRHISHVGGRDVDIALPADDGIPSTVRDHCKGVLIDKDRYGCAPGTVRGVDALRLAYFLGLLIDGSPPQVVSKIYIDDAYLREVRNELDTLRDRKWIKDAGYAALVEEDGIVVASPWHTDHVHVRWAGEEGDPAFAVPPGE